MLPTLYKTNRYWKIEYSVDYKKRIGMLMPEYGVCGTDKPLGTPKEIKIPVKFKTEKEMDEYVQSKALSAWTDKKTNGGYSESKENADAIRGIIVNSPISPMLAIPWDEKHLHFPCYVQNKFDGARCIAVPIVEEGKDKAFTSTVNLYSRKRNLIPTVEHINRDLVVLYEVLEDSELFDYLFSIDGELYSEHDTFEGIVSKMKNVKKSQEDSSNAESLVYYIYDVVEPNYTFDDRLKVLEYLAEIIEDYELKSIQIVKTHKVNDRKELDKLFDHYVKSHKEGIIIRSPKGKYVVDKRSNDLMKKKASMDEEFEIIDVIEGQGILAGKVGSFLCRLNELVDPSDPDSDVNTFNVKPEGSHQQLKDWFENKDTLIGKLVTVEFANWTDQKKPRHPVGKAIRDYE